MTTLFLKILNMSLTADWLILAVMIARLLLSKAPRKFICLLWAFVAVRLILPVSLGSIVSLIPSGQVIPADIALSPEPEIHSGLQFVDRPVNALITETFAPDPASSANPLQIVIPIAAGIWAAGVLAMLLYSVIRYLKLKKTLVSTVCIEEGIVACDEVKSPFILGIFRPIIYVPSTMTDEALAYVICHEKAHLARLDHLWKPLAYLILAIHWFNPLCWAAYVLLCRDIEIACDEKAIQSMDANNIAAYAQTLLDYSRGRQSVFAYPLTFGEVGIKQRIVRVLQYRKPAFIMVLASVILCLGMAACLMTDPIGESSAPNGENGSDSAQTFFQYAFRVEDDMLQPAKFDFMMSPQEVLERLGLDESMLVEDPSAGHRIIHPMQLEGYSENINEIVEFQDEYAISVWYSIALTENAAEIRDKIYSEFKEGIPADASNVLTTPRGWMITDPPGGDGGFRVQDPIDNWLTGDFTLSTPGADPNVRYFIVYLHLSREYAMQKMQGDS